MRRYVERDLWRYRLEVCTEVGCLHRPHAHAIQWRIVEQLFREQQRRYYGGIALQVLKSRGCEDLSRLSSPRKRGPDNSGLWNIDLRPCAEDSGEPELGLVKPAIGIGSVLLAIYLRFIPAGHVRSCRPGMYRSPGYPRGTADNGRP